MLEQILIPLFWLPGYAMVLHAKKKTLGYLWGICAFPFSIHSTYAHQQWGMLLLEVVACCIWVSAWWRYSKNK